MKTGSGRDRYNYHPHESGEGRPSLRAEHVLVTRRRVVEAFTAQLVARGYAGVSLREVSRLAGLSVPTLYRYFPDKAAILVTLARSLAEEISAALPRELSDPSAARSGALTSDQVERAATLLDAVWGAAERQPERMSACLQALNLTGLDVDLPYFGAGCMDSLLRAVLLPEAESAPKARVAMLALLLGPQTWYSLRVEQGLPCEAARGYVLSTIDSLLS